MGPTKETLDLLGVIFLVVTIAVTMGGLWTVAERLVIYFNSNIVSNFGKAVVVFLVGITTCLVAFFLLLVIALQFLSK